MTKLYNGKFAMGAIFTLIAVFSQVSMAHGSDDDRDDSSKSSCQTETVSQTVSGPANYHSVYGNIVATNITIQNYHLRTEDGQVVDVNTDPMTVNLQDLKAFTKGLVLDLAQVNFPGGADQIQVAEIETDVVNSSSQAAGIVSNDNSTCNFARVPKHLNFYTSESIALKHDVYHVKIDFAALNGVQIDVVSTVTQNKCCTSSSSCGDGNHDGHHKSAGLKEVDFSRKSLLSFVKVMAQSQSGSGSSCSIVGNPVTTSAQKCGLANRRYGVVSIPLAVDDEF